MQEPLQIPTETVAAREPVRPPHQYHFNFPLMLTYPLQIFGLSAIGAPFERVQLIKQCRPDLAALGFNYTSTGSIIKGSLISDWRIRNVAIFQGNSHQCLQNLL